MKLINLLFEKNNEEGIFKKTNFIFFLNFVQIIAILCVSANLLLFPASIILSLDGHGFSSENYFGYFMIGIIANEFLFVFTFLILVILLLLVKGKKLKKSKYFYFFALSPFIPIVLFKLTEIVINSPLW